MWPAANVGGVSQRSQPRASRTSSSTVPGWPKEPVIQSASTVAVPLEGPRLGFGMGHFKGDSWPASGIAWKSQKTARAHGTVFMAMRRC